MVLGDSQSSRHYIYDCKFNSLQQLVSLTSNDFYIVSKKYEWFTCFNLEKAFNVICNKTF